MFGLECRSALSNPAAKLQWFNGTNPVSVLGLQYTMAFPSGVRTYQRWFVRADDRMTGQLITCRAVIPGTNSSAFDSVVVVVGPEMNDMGKMALSAQNLLNNPAASIMSFIKAVMGTCFNYLGA